MSYIIHNVCKVVGRHPQLHQKYLRIRASENYIAEDCYIAEEHVLSTVEYDSRYDGYNV